MGRTSQRQKVPVEQVEQIVQMLKSLPEFKDKTERFISEQAGLGPGLVDDVAKLKGMARYRYYALLGLFYETYDPKNPVRLQLLDGAKLSAAHSADEAGLLFAACQLAIKARPESADAYRKLMAHFAKEIVRLA